MPSMVPIHAVVLDASFLQGSDAVQCLQRLQWGNLNVAVVGSQPGPAPVTGITTLSVPSGTAGAEELRSWLGTEGLAAAAAIAVVPLGCEDCALGAAAPAAGIAVWQVGGSSAAASQNQAAPARTPYILPSLSALPLRIGHEQHRRQPEARLVGYTMKASREKDLSAARMLTLLPKDGLCFVPVDISQCLDQQQPFHIMLHKASDELEVVKRHPEALPGVHGSQQQEAEPAAGEVVPRFSARIAALQQYLAQHPEICVVDPFHCTAKVIDRRELCRVTESLKELDCGPGAPQVLAPPYCVLESTSNRQLLLQQVAEAGLQPPLIVKPLVACGLADSHQMALVLNTQALSQLPVPLPCIVQQFVNHDGRVYKVYVAGRKVFHSVRPSIPNIAPCLLTEPGSAGGDQHSQEHHTSTNTSGSTSTSTDISGILTFDSLKSLPTSLPHLTSPHTANPVASSTPVAPPGAAAAAAAGAPAVNSSHDVDSAVLEKIAAHLQKAFGLRLFGFDVVVDCSNGNHLVIDVNYFPSYRAEGADAWFRQALAEAWAMHKPTAIV